MKINDNGGCGWHMFQEIKGQMKLQKCQVSETTKQDGLFSTEDILS